MNILIHGMPDNNFYQWLLSKNNQEKLIIHVAEGRPQLSGVKIVAQRLAEMEMNVTVISDNMIAFLMSQLQFDAAFIFYYEKDDGYITCQIGSLILVVCAKVNQIPIICRPAGKKDYQKFGQNDDLFLFDGVRVAPKGIQAYVPLVEKIQLNQIEYDVSK